MNIETILIITMALITFLFPVSTLKKLPKVRYAFIVPEGYAGLLYRNGKFVEQLAPGRHMRWGRNITLDAQDTRKTFLAVAGQSAHGGQHRHEAQHARDVPGR